MLQSSRHGKGSAKAESISVNKPDCHKSGHLITLFNAVSARRFLFFGDLIAEENEFDGGMGVTVSGPGRSGLFFFLSDRLVKSKENT